MDILELASIAKAMNEQGLEKAPLLMKSPNFKSKYPKRVRTPFGLCEWSPSNHPSHIIIHVRFGQIFKYLKKCRDKLAKIEEAIAS